MKSLIRDYFCSLSFVPLNPTSAGIRFPNGSWNGSLELFEKNYENYLNLFPNK